MTVRFRVDTLRLETTAGDVTYAFGRDLTVLAGHTGVGKTTLLEILKFALGGDALLAPVARRDLVDVHVSLRIGDARLQLSRALDPDRRRTVRVVDLVTAERLPDCQTSGDERTLNELLMTALGLETGLKAAARGKRSTSAGAQITFNDVFKYMYVPQAEMNRDIAGSQDGYYDPKRKSVFELMFGITTADMLQMRSEINLLKGQIDAAEHDAGVVAEFLAATGLTSRFEAEAAFTDAQNRESESRATLASLHGQVSSVIDRESQVLRDLLTDAERALAEARELSTELARQRQEYEAEGRRIAQDIDRLARAEAAGLRLANIEFVVCPRCTQRLDQRDVPSEQCPVCLQADVIEGLPAANQYEGEQLRTQRDEIQDQLRIIAAQAAQSRTAEENRASLVSSLSREIDERTSSRVTPRLQAYADAAARAERAAAEQESLDLTLRQWDRAEDLSLAADELGKRRGRLQKELQTKEGALERRKDELFADLDQEFQQTVFDFGIPSVETASISRTTYLPLLNGGPFQEASAGGGIITATQVAYWLTLLTVAGRWRDTRLPAFLVLDSPRIAVSTSEDIAGQMYRRFVTQVDATPGRFQFIVADNELPAGIKRDFDEIAFSYDEPTIGTIPHPGPAHVKALAADFIPSSDGGSTP
ncbi:AAA family ATPase [Pedococcus sp. P5_B7]